MNIKCPKCQGSGEVNLSPSLQSVVDAVADKPASIYEIYTSLPEQNVIAITAVHQRVKRLINMKLIKKVAKSSPARYTTIK